MGKIHHCAAIRAYQVVVVLGDSSEEITWAMALTAHLTDKTQFVEHVQGTVDGNQPNAGVCPMGPLVYDCRGEMTLAQGNHPQYRSPLRSKLVSFPLQRRHHFFQCGFHPFLS